MNLSASDIYSLHRPSRCERRVFLRFHNEPEGEPSEFDKLLDELGQRHEAKHLSAFPKYDDLRGGSLEERIVRTAEALESGAEVVYQGVLEAPLPGTGDSVRGIPDFLIKDGNSYRIHDCKLARHADEDHHEEILLQLQLYGWLFEMTFHLPPTLLEVYLGDESIVPISYDGGGAALEVLKDIRRLGQLSEEPYSPVGWSKCGGCGFQPRCWKMAEESNDVAVVYGVDQGIAFALRGKGITSIKDLIKQFDDKTLSELKRVHGNKLVRVGKAATRILQQAEALRSNREMLLSPLPLPIADNMVMFDLEGLPPQFDELDKIYLWGTKVYGKRPGRYVAALAGFGVEGDKEGWDTFLSNSESIFSSYGDIPFVHWHHYETTKVHAYIDRYGDRNAIGDRVLRNCVDLHKITKESLVLPEYSYSLKVVEKRAGFRRTMEESGGQWSIVQYIRAVETEDEALRTSIMSEIMKYNEEDLEATWAVLEWLGRK